jgi:uncharacterized protein YndB with AHSA1/START domain
MTNLENLITIQSTILAPTLNTWKCYTDPEHITQWSFASDDWCCPKAENDLKVGGVFSTRMEAKDGLFGFDFGGYYTAVDKEKLIRYVMSVEPNQTPESGRKVEINFEKINASETRVTISFEPENENPKEMQQTGWQTILDNFKKYTEKNYRNETVTEELITPPSFV